MPDWRAELRRRVAQLGLPPAREEAIVDEMAEHLSDRFAELCGGGMDPGAAADMVRAEHLNDATLAESLAATEPRAATAGPVLGGGAEGPLTGFAADLRYAARSLHKNPGVTVVALLTLVIGIGANTAIFSAVNAVLLRPPPFEEPDRLVTFWGTAPDKGLPVVNYPDALYAWYRTRLRSVDPMAMYASAGFTLGGSGDPERLDAAYVTVDFFRVLGARPHVGRLFLAEEESPGNNPVTVLSYGLWQRRFGGDPAIVGRPILLDDLPTTVAGVLKPGFTFPDRTELWVPITIDPTSLNCWCYDAIGRLAQGSTAAHVAREVDALNAGFWADREGRPPEPPVADAAPGTIVRSLARELVGEIRTPLLVLLGAVAMVLLIACANVANLLLARSVARGREIAVRSALGASPRRLARQLLVESLLLALTGAALGLLAAVPATEFLRRQALERLAHVGPFGFDPVVLAFTASLGVLAGVVFGFAPALRASRTHLASQLKDGPRTGGTAGSRRLSDAFVVTQLALSLVLLVSAGLLLRSFARLMRLDPGFEPRGVVVARIAVPWTRYREMAEVRPLVARLEERLRARPGVTAAALTSTAPFSPGDNYQELLAQGQEPGPDEPVPVTSVRRVTAGYFAAVGTRVLEGREFTVADRDDTEAVAIIDSSLAHRYWPGGGAVGQRISTGSVTEPVWRTVVGVVESIRHGRLDRALDHYVYYPLGQDYAWTLDLVVRSSLPPAALIGPLRAEVSAIDPGLPVYDIHTMEEAVDRSASTRRFVSLLLLGFAATAVLLAAIGVFGVMARNAAARVREFGIRLALGAKPRQIERLVLRRGVRLLLIGAAIGTAAAVGLTRALRGLLFDVEPLDPATFAVTLSVLGAVALAACWIPARRATSADPLEAIKAE